MAHFDDQIALVQALFASGTGVPEPGVAGPGTPDADAPLAPGKPWKPFLDRLREVTQADGTALCIEQDGRAGRSWSVGACPTLDQDVQQGLRNDRVYSQENLPWPSGAGGPTRVVKARVSQTSRVVVWIYRAHHHKDFRSADGQQLSAIAPYLGQAAEIWIALGQERARAALNSRLGMDLGAGWVVFDRTGTVTDLSSTARALAAGAGLRLSRRKRPGFSDPQAAYPFRAAVAACSAGSKNPVSVTLADDPSVEMVLTNDCVAGENVLLGIVRAAPVATDIPITRIARHFGLSPSEARLARLLCDGFTIRSAALRLGWTEETARTCSKRIFSRTGVRGQTGLLRKMLGSAVWFRGKAETG